MPKRLVWGAVGVAVLVPGQPDEMWNCYQILFAVSKTFPLFLLLPQLHRTKNGYGMVLQSNKLHTAITAGMRLAAAPKAVPTPCGGGGLWW